MTLTFKYSYTGQCTVQTRWLWQMTVLDSGLSEVYFDRLLYWMVYCTSRICLWQITVPVEFDSDRLLYQWNSTLTNYCTMNLTLTDYCTSRIWLWQITVPVKFDSDRLLYQFGTTTVSQSDCIPGRQLLYHYKQIHQVNILPGMWRGNKRG